MLRPTASLSFRVLAGSTLILILSTTTIHAQSRTGARPTMDRASEIALARSAAPTQVSGNARVWIWNGTRYEVAERGSTGVNCFLSRAWVPSVEPHCLDAEASRTILPILMRKIELYAQGRTDSLVEREIAAGIRSGRFKLPTKPAVTYMMSAAQELVGGNGSAVGAWQPHLMIYYPNWTGEQAGLPGFVPDVGFIENPGTPLAAFVVPLKTFVPKPAP
jgi:hypothetical protein